MNPKDYEELSDYAELEGSELGEYTTSLLCLSEYNTDHGMGDEFESAIAFELERLLGIFQKHANIVTRTESHTIEKRELEWK